MEENKQAVTTFEEQVNGASDGHGQFDISTCIDAGSADDLVAGKASAKKAELARAAMTERGMQAVEQVRRTEPNLVKRAKALAKDHAFSFKSLKSAKLGNSIVAQATNCDSNRWAVFDTLFGSGDDRPHLDLFSGRIVDHVGTTIDDRYPVIDLLHAVESAGLKDQNAEQVRRSLKEFALHVKWNSLIKRVERMMPQWDGKERLETELINRFECFDTPLNRGFGKYFWLSLYCRVMYPGCYAPMVLTLIGAQDSGKSYFAKRIVQVITGEGGADSVQLDLSGDKLGFLREITGHSIVANIGEMTGLDRGDLNKIKAFVTQTSDPMHYKYEGNFTQQRQWIAMMDGNKYEGMQRDDTGNRRFYPMFVGQLEHCSGQPQWKTSFTANFDGFDASLWQIMTECRDWLSRNGELPGYEDFAKEVSKEVSNFSREEMKNNSGTIADPELDLYFQKTLRKSDKRSYQRRGADKRKGVIVMQDDFATTYKLVSRINRTVNLRHLGTKMSSIGAEYDSYAGGRKGFFFPQYESVEQMHAAMDSPESEDGVLGEIVKADSEGF